MGQLINKNGLRVHFSQTFYKLSQRWKVLGHDEQLVQARAVHIRDGDCFKADHARFTPEQVLISLIGQIGGITLCISIGTFHCLAKKSVHTGAGANLDR